MLTSPDPLLRLIRSAPLPPPSPSRILGLDDWALRKGRTYGSILVDLEAHCVRVSRLGQSGEGQSLKRAKSICRVPSTPAELKREWPGLEYPLAGSPPAVSCNDNPTKFEEGYRFKLFASPDSNVRLDYVETPEEMLNACWNAGIEQQKAWRKSFAVEATCSRFKATVQCTATALKTLCDIQLQDCKNSNQAHLDDSCTTYGGP